MNIKKYKLSIIDTTDPSIALKTLPISSPMFPNMSSRLRVNAYRHHDLLSRYKVYVSRMTTEMFQFVVITNPMLSSFMTYHRVCNKRNTTVATCEERISYSSGTPKFTPSFSGVRVTRSLVLCVCFVDRCLSFCTFSFGHCVVLFFFDLRILITPLLSSISFNSGLIQYYNHLCWDVATYEKYIHN